MIRALLVLLIPLCLYSQAPLPSPNGAGGGGGGGGTGCIPVGAANKVVLSDGSGGCGITATAAGFVTFVGVPTSANLASLVTDETGSGALMFANNPTLIAPVLGAAMATSINKVAFTAPATGSTLTIADGKTLTDTSAVGAVPLKGAAGGGFAAEVAADVVSLFSTCSGSQYLGADGACHNASGAGTVTSIATTSPLGGGTITTSGTLTCTTCTTNASPLTNLSIMAGGGSQASKITNIVTDSGLNNLTLPAGGILTAPGGTSTGTTPPSLTAGTGGVIGACGEGTAPSVGITAGVDLAYCDSTRHAVLLSDNGDTAAIIARGPASSTANHTPTFNGSDGGLLKDSGLTLTASTGTFTLTNGKTFAVQNSLTIASTDGITETTPATSFTTARTDAGQTFTGTQVLTATLGSTSTATTQSAGSNDTKIATDAYVDATKCTTTKTTGTTATLSTCFTVNQEATAAAGVTYTLPTAATGLQYCIDNDWNGSAATTGVLTFATSASGQFMTFTDGTLTATGGNVTSGGAARDGACVYGIDSTHWMFLPHAGTWTKH